MQDISGFGIKVNIVASKTYPQGVQITQFSDDGDPYDSPSIQIADKAMGVNGDLITWSKANALIMTLNVIPNSEDDRVLQTLFEQNRPARGKQPARDVITATVIYPDGKTDTFSPGAITDGIPGKPVASSGRMKTKPYAFAFENKQSN